MKAIDDVVEHLSRLPGIGKKTATRLAYYLLSRDAEQTKQLAKSLNALHEHIRICPVCGSFTDGDFCDFCDDASRDRSVICVVERQQELISFSELTEYRGLFHVLGGVISPLDGIGPDRLAITQLLDRLKDDSVKEVILATNPTIEGDTTALYVQKLLKDYPVHVTRLASGIPAGGDLEYADKLTLLRSLRGRSSF
ncbi:MAG: recombination mediator RecR [Treponemataceae bacterium]